MRSGPMVHRWQTHQEYLQPGDTGAMAVKERLSDRSEAFRTSRLKWVESVVVFTNPLCRLEISRPGPTIIRYSELPGLIAEKARRRALDASQCARIAATLA